MKFCFIVGTRPEVIKVAPVYKFFLQMNEEAFVVATAQHREMMDMMLNVFEIETKYDLNVMTHDQTLDDVVASIMQRLPKILQIERPDILLVQGDTTTALSCALCAFHWKIPVAHIEAGLRSHDLYDPFPEEMNRRVIDAVSEYLFAPTNKAKENLIKEGIEENRIHVVGNSVVDALKIIKEKFDLHEIRSRTVPFERYILLTLHRRENIGERMISILSGVARFAMEHDVHVVLPVHKNPKVRQIVFETVRANHHFFLMEPVDYVTFLALLEGCWFVVTDSGGVQEEAPSFGKFVVVARRTTERPELIESGFGTLAGASEESVYRAMVSASEVELDSVENPFGDGKTSERIWRILRSVAR
ncbi:UDP-N-acetylglucosamine 2-epimerase (non-hydrolyzing) [Pseudothermotoga sp.]|uniref:non-hydrolyzing UDP-N-acetylglucosamine 2-epimerase n=1 Tax=Pseudothermotoga sp. TaxID=2033661 RepID=UPI0031F6DBBF